jgi:hypothetical protein
MFELLGERAHTLKLARRRRKTVLCPRHGFRNIYESLLLEVENEIDDLSIAAT